MATNDFLVFGGGSSPNVIDQATYAALAARLSGFQSGTALSAQLNKVWRQSSIMAAVLAQFTANFSGQNAVDDGTIGTLLANLQTAINAAGITAPQFDNSLKLATTAFVQRALGSFSNVTLVQGGAVTLNSSSFGTAIQISGPSSTITLPSGSGVNPGGTIRFYAQGAAGSVYNIVTTGGGFIYAPGAGMGSSNTTLTLGINDTVELTNRGGNEWDVTGGSWIVSNEAIIFSSKISGTTAPQFDNGTKLATTAFVQRALGNFQNFYAYQNSQTLIAAQAGSLIDFWGSSAATFTLPAATAMPTSGMLYFINSGSAAVTVSRAGTDTILNTGGSTNVVLNPGDSLLIATTNGPGQWIAIGGTAAIQFNPLVVAPATQSQHAMQLGQAVGRLLNIRVITASGTYTPTAGTNSVVVRAIGGGGAGGGAAANSSSQISAGSGGASGSYAEARYTSGFSGVAVTIGAGGTGVSAGAGNPGGTTSFGSLLTCPGGGGGQIQQQSTSSTTLNVPGQGSPGAAPSGSGILLGTQGQPGVIALILGSVAISGQGAAGAMGAGGPNSANSAGNPGTGYGAGGAGGASIPSASAVAGGNGAPGIVIVMEYA
ncbi:hypothetical protein [Burkholderia sp. BCC0097]|uniref:glycine-rich domain-containing protein n=1 Tax=Burkholderia sp. BCC0097 TaxID=2676289 RepID=UPI00158CA812|nr:hypothetical protein [Burkholderia sp. BCC0097]